MAHNAPANGTPVRRSSIKLTANGMGGNPSKIMFYLGMFFVILGLVIGLGVLFAVMADPIPEMYLFVFIFMGVFCGIGGLFAKLGYDNIHAGDKILEQGASYLGKIFGYEPDYQILMNGQPCVNLVVRYLKAGQISETRVNTGEVDPTPFPRGATVSIKVLDGVAALVPGSVSDMHIEQEEDLMNPDFDPLGTASSIGVSCPNCSANIVVPIGMSRFCPYCDTKVSVTPDGRVIG